ncbi:uncharacterized protein Z520_06853 [Fonsecaea multimorphosa CBS 102226]|uniref:Uncharacterized protein n=1 Tax=Fonsecaea multimorphosa CBS 102226 TaxID=1442371 RepID=A0A0D2IK32_9EURO|nr:uncharacterized protein Z520_06853 [Fonsecaea multimorphosa CBS 102226]KIX97401.1 hypothetical protein Z520_06853 [Fonsecaea multimorphosa CBS 102226]OAL23368.1 hypothetical protein AYO22_06418 [Fonsecaea multimorphosa]
MFRFANAIPSLRGATKAPVEGDANPSGEADDQVPPLNTISSSNGQDTTPIQGMPSWARELNNARANRHSRASSIVSTQSKFTTTTLHEDARSIDINVAGQYFRISRDGSRITADAPPPYTGPGEAMRFQGDGMSDVVSLLSLDSRLEVDSQNVDEDNLEDGSTTPRSAFTAIDHEGAVRANILDLPELEMPSPMGHDQLNHRSSLTTPIGSERTTASTTGLDPSLSSGDDSEILPQPSPDHRGRRATSEDLTRDGADQMPQSSPLRRTYRERLPRLITSREISRANHRPQHHRQRSYTSRGRPLQIRSAGAILDDVPDDHESRSPDYIGRNARGRFPVLIRAATTQNTSALRNGESSARGVNPLDMSETPEDSNTPLPMDDENDISLHYARMMRRLDSTHRKALLFKDKQVAELREKLNEKDIVLRQQLRAKDFIIDDLKKRLNNLEENVEVMLEKARHQVEDLWESRWKDRDFHLRERMRRIEEEAQKTLERVRICQAQSEREPKDNNE